MVGNVGMVIEDVVEEIETEGKTEIEIEIEGIERGAPVGTELSHGEVLLMFSLLYVRV